MTLVWREPTQPGWIDYNGHLSEAYYVLVMGHATDAVMDAVGLGPEHRAAHDSSLYTVEERMALLSEVTAVYGNVKVDSFHGLLVDYCRERDIPVIVKGLRAISDFDYELQMAQMNHGLAGVETMFMTTNPLYSFLSSSLVKEVATYGGDVSGLVPERVLARLTERLAGS